MEITKHNFMEHLPKINTEIEKADFISIDLQSTGIGQHDISTCSSSEERYKDLVPKIQEYGVLQVGLSIFQFEDTLKNSTYTFHLSGDLKCSHVFDPPFWCYLAEKGWDFNKCFKDGLTHMPLEKVFAAEEKMKDKQHSDNFNTVQIKSNESKEFFEKAKIKIQEAQDSGDKCVFEKKTLSFFHLKVLKNNLAELFPLAAFDDSDEENVQVIFFESKEEKYQFIVEKEQENLKKETGFGLIVRKILECEIPMVGHNAWLQLMHFFDKFVQPLPDNLSSFLTELDETMPPVYDTQLLAASKPIKKFFLDLGIKEMFSRMISKPFYHVPVSSSEGSETFSTEQVEDNILCGYQAFMVGCSFLTMLKKHGMPRLRTNPLETEKFAKLKPELHISKTFEGPLINHRNTKVPNMSEIYKNSSQSDVPESRMDITRHNFEERYEEICDEIDKADFISFDFEFSGLGQRGSSSYHKFDSAEERYKKSADDVRQYGVTQIGLSMFRQTDGVDCMNTTYCFNLTGSSDQPIRYDVSSMVFLSNNNFDHNKCLKEGLPFSTYLSEGSGDKKDEMEIGFGKIARKLLKSHKPFVGHNMWMDMLHFVDKFLIPVPTSFPAFQLLTKNTLPPIYDTKLLSKNDKFGTLIVETGLSALYNTVTKTPFSPLCLKSEEKRETYSIGGDGGSCHDAGYDAFMTGVCFASMVRHLSGTSKFQLKETDFLATICNKVNFMFSWDMPYIDLHEPMDIPDRSHVYVVECPESWTAKDVKNVFHEKLGTYSTLWVSSTKLYVVPTNPDLIGDKTAERLLTSSAPLKVRITMYPKDNKMPQKQQPKKVLQTAKRSIEDVETKTPSKKPKKEKMTPSEPERELFKVPDEW